MLLLFKKLGNFGYKHAKMKKYLISLCIVLFTTYASNAEDVTSEAIKATEIGTDLCMFDPQEPVVTITMK